MNHEAREHLEIERKYEVASQSVMPTQFGPDVLVSEATVFDLRATYFDTTTRLLAGQRIAVRHRLGGTDAGWHVKQRVAEGVHEFEWPDTATMPEALFTTLQRLTGGQNIALHPIATINTIRTSRMLTDTTGKKLIELVDDSVTASDEVKGVHRSWREWEAELMPDAPPEVLDSVEPVLVTAGALASLNESKISRTMGAALQLAATRGAQAELLASLAVTDAADRLAAEGNDPRVGQLRVIARNLRASSNRVGV